MVEINLEIKINGFEAININGITTTIYQLAKKIISSTNSGDLKLETIPMEIQKVDMGGGSMDDTLLKSYLPSLKYSDIDFCLNQTIKYFKKGYDLEM